MPQNESGKKHIAELEPDQSHAKGCVTKHENDFKNNRCAYRYQGYAAITSDPKKKVLYELDFTDQDHKARLPALYEELKRGLKREDGNKRTPDDPRVAREVWGFGGENYKIAYLPINHNYHHILPFECLKQLSYTELKLLQESGYNLNSGGNLIILPCLDKYAYALMLPAHPHNHGQYNRDIKALINKLKQVLVRQSANHEIDPSNVGNIKAILEAWQADEFWVIVDYGQSEARAGRHAMINRCPVATIRHHQV